jgi:L,D-transpeptidase ErfK/SrfK
VPESIRRDHAKYGDMLPAAVSPGPDNPLGDYAMYLSRPRYLIHGTNKPYAIGLRASNGCLRLYPENIDALFKSIPLKTPVRIVNQPYLVGKYNGTVYLQAYEPHEELSERALIKGLKSKLKQMEKKEGLALDWDKIASVVDEARGIPTPVTSGSPATADVVQQAVLLESPDEWYGRPQPPLSLADDNGWYIELKDTEDELTAQRTAAVLNHMGPQIPALALPLESGRYRVIAGPFKDAKTTKSVAKRMLVDLEITGTVVPPGKMLAMK